MVRDMAMIDTAMSFAGRNLEILRKAVATWSHLVASPSAFVASATAGPYQTSTEVSISVKRQTPQISAPFPTVALGLLASERLVIDGPESEEKKTCECAAQTNRTTTVSTQQQPSEEKTVATAVLHLDVEPRVQVSAGVSYSMAYNAPTFTITKHNEETATVTESVRGNGRTAPHSPTASPHVATVVPERRRQSFEIGCNWRARPRRILWYVTGGPRIPALGMLSLGATYYRRAVLTPGVTVGSPIRRAQHRAPYHQRRPCRDHRRHGEDTVISFSELGLRRSAESRTHGSCFGCYCHPPPTARNNCTVAARYCRSTCTLVNCAANNPRCASSTSR